jgi:hypothetical protein
MNDNAAEKMINALQARLAALEAAPRLVLVYEDLGPNPLAGQPGIFGPRAPDLSAPIGAYRDRGEAEAQAALQPGARVETHLVVEAAGVVQVVALGRVLTVVEPSKESLPR